MSAPIRSSSPQTVSIAGKREAPEPSSTDKKVVDVAKKSKPNQLRCDMDGCRTKLGPFDRDELACRCTKTFCQAHRPPPLHNCPVDRKIKLEDVSPAPREYKVNHELGKGGATA